MDESYLIKWQEEKRRSGICLYDDNTQRPDLLFWEAFLKGAHNESM
jgi:hypothetical protein